MSDLVGGLTSKIGLKSETQDYQKLKPKVGGDDSGRSVSTESRLSSSDRSSDVFQTHEADLRTSSSLEEAQASPLYDGSGSVSTAEDLPPEPKASMDKTHNCVERFFKGLIEKFKASLDQRRSRQQHLHHREQISQNPHSAKLSQTLNKFLGKQMAGTRKEPESGLGDYIYEEPRLSRFDIENLNNYFSGDHIEAGLDGLTDLYKAGNVEEFSNILRALTPENFSRVEASISQVEDGGRFQQAFLTVSAENTQVKQHMAEAVEALKTAKDTGSIQEGIKGIHEQALSGLPSNASDDAKQDAVAQAFTRALSQLSPVSKHKEANQALSYELGKLVLRPLTTREGIQSASTKIGEWVEKGKNNTPGNCGKDLYRFTPRIDLYGKNGEHIVDRSNLAGQSGKKKDIATGKQMVLILNQFYREVSGLDTDLITEQDLGKMFGKDSASIDSQTEAITFAEKLGKLMEEKGVKTLDQAQMMNCMALMGMQEIPTRVGEWAIPGGATPDGSTPKIANNYRLGQGGLKVSEFSALHKPRMAPLGYERTVSLSIRPDGKFEYKLYNPVTFTDMSDKNQQTGVGTCGVSSVLIFDSNMQLESMSQEVVPAPIIE